MKYIWNNFSTLDKKTGGSKARKDVSFILKNKGYKTINYINSSNIFLKFVFLIVNIIMFLCLVRSRSEIFLQYPFNSAQRKLLPFFKKIKNLRFIMLIHDLESLRLHRKASIEIKDLKMIDGVISLNQAMSNYIVEHLYYNPDRIVNLGLWDYLDIHNNLEEQVFDLTVDVGKKIKVLISGNLDSKKAAYLSQLDKIRDVHFFLLGSNYNSPSSLDNVSYLGSFDPNKPVKLITNDDIYALIWDGDSILSCLGQYGDYLRYNLPHKTSFYLSKKLPVLVWRQAEVAKVLDREGVLAAKLDSLFDILHLKQQEDIHKGLFLDIYDRINKGYYLSSAIDKLNNNLGKL